MSFVIWPSPSEPRSRVCLPDYVIFAKRLMIGFLHLARPNCPRMLLTCSSESGSPQHGQMMGRYASGAAFCSMPPSYGKAREISKTQQVKAWRGRV